MPRHVTNLSELPSSGQDLNEAFRKIEQSAPCSSALDFGRAILSGKGQLDAAFSSLVMLRKGTLVLVTPEGIRLDLAAGQIATLPSGALDWRADQADCVIVILRGDNPVLALQALDLSHPLSPGGAPNAALLDTPMPETKRHTFFEQGKLSWGLWSATPYLRRGTPCAHTEITWLTRGSMALTGAGGDSAHFATGDICAVCAGAEVSWQNAEYIEKFWLIRSE